jgi:ankyrin repeat protein
MSIKKSNLRRFSFGSKGSKKLESICEFGDENELLAYLKKKKNLHKVNQPNKKGIYPIHILASFPGRSKMVKILLEHGNADPNVIEGSTKNSVLHFAAQNNDLELFQMLVQLPNLTGNRIHLIRSSKRRQREMRIINGAYGFFYYYLFCCG